MRAVLILVAVVTLLALLGWITVSRTQDSASINFDAREAREDTEHAVETVQKSFDDLSDKVEETRDRSTGDQDDRTAVPESPADSREPAPVIP